MGKKRSIGSREMMILNIVWDRGELTVRDVYKAISESEEIAYTSIMTTMQNMEKKGLLVHRTENRAYIYSASVEKNEIQGNLVKDLLDSVFMGSYENLVASLVQNKNISPEDIMEIADKYIDKKE